jgi:hypothetical protein
MNSNMTISLPISISTLDTPVSMLPEKLAKSTSNTLSSHGEASLLKFLTNWQNSMARDRSKMKSPRILKRDKIKRMPKKKKLSMLKSKMPSSSSLTKMLAKSLLLSTESTLKSCSLVILSSLKARMNSLSSNLLKLRRSPSKIIKIFKNLPLKSLKTPKVQSPHRNQI